MRARHLCPILLVAFTVSAAGMASRPRAPVPVALDRHLPGLQRNLEHAILAFWYPRAIDRHHGGYLIAFDNAGARTPDGSKMIVSQARMVWFFSRLARAGHRREEMLEAARHGYRFLMDRLWDRDHGGFYWEIDEAGTRVTEPHKHMYGQAFGLYAASELALASGDAAVRAEADRIFQLLDARAYDPVHGGYREFFSREWGTPPPGVKPYLGGGADGSAKLMNTHLHLMEALTTYYRLTNHAIARERLLELVRIQSNTVVRKDLGACTDVYRADWTPVLEGPGARVSYGHDLENIWLLADALDALGLSNAPLVDLYRTLFDYSLRWGYDRDAGGFFSSGSFRAPADQREKVWWVQAEALVSALTMYRLTGDPVYATVFEETWRFTDERQTDHVNGEWFATLWPDGRVSPAKAHKWKAAYHQGRAMIEAIRIIQALRTGPGQPTPVPPRPQ